jgi:hypothetical protein
VFVNLREMLGNPVVVSVEHDHDLPKGFTQRMNDQVGIIQLTVSANASGIIFARQSDDRSNTKHHANGNRVLKHHPTENFTIVSMVYSAYDAQHPSVPCRPSARASSSSSDA